MGSRPETMRFLYYFLIYLFLFLLLRSIIRVFVGGYRKAGGVGQNSRQAPGGSSAGELKKSPVCGTYVSPVAGFTRTVKGQVFYFCSKDCRDKYLT